jgi:hypothetical protein
MEGVFGHGMVVHRGKVAQLEVHGGKVLGRCSLWGQKVVSPFYFIFFLSVLNFDCVGKQFLKTKRCFSLLALILRGSGKREGKENKQKQKGRENTSKKLGINNRKNHTYPLKLPLYLQWHLQKILMVGQLKGVDK